jgi:hypothetical protein
MKNPKSVIARDEVIQFSVISTIGEIPNEKAIKFKFNLTRGIVK